MSVKRPSLVARLMIGGSALALMSLGGAAQAAEAAAPPFGAPALPVVASTPADAGRPAAASAKPVAGASFLPARAVAQDPAAGAGAGAATTEPNLSALRFYAGQNDLARVAAEIRLLRAKFPGWEPPADLFVESRGGESEQPLWDLFAKHDLAGLKAAIADRQHETPGWQPSTDLATKLANAEAYDALVQASDRKDYGTVVDLATGNSGLMTCGNVDAVWRTAEALALTGEEAHALGAYRYVLANCTNPQERLATVQKASLVIKASEAIDSLVRMGKRLPNGTSEFADTHLDGVRQRVGDAAAGRTPTHPSAADLDQLGARARMADGGKDAELLGWYALSRKDAAGAETWFRAAMQPNVSAKAAEGLVLALREGGKGPEAVKLAAQYAGLGTLNRKLMMEIMVATLADAKEPPGANQLAMLGAAIDAEKSADAAQSFGWSRFKANDVASAQGWFRKSLGWQSNEAAAVGLMLTAKRLKQGANYATVVSQYKATFPRVAELDAVMKRSDSPARLAKAGSKQRVASRNERAARGDRVARGDGWDGSATAIVQTFEGGHVDQALAMMDARRASRQEPRGLSVVRGWALYKKGDWEGAKQVFTDVSNRGMQDEAEKGLKQIELGYTNPRFR